MPASVVSPIAAPGGCSTQGLPGSWRGSARKCAGLWPTLPERHRDAVGGVYYGAPRTEGGSHATARGWGFLARQEPGTRID